MKRKWPKLNYQKVPKEVLAKLVDLLINEDISWSNFLCRELGEEKFDELAEKYRYEEKGEEDDLDTER